MQNDASPTDPRLARTVDAFRDLVVHNLFHTHGQDIESANLHDAYMALSYAVRDHLVDRWRSTNVARHDGDSKVVHYLSAEYLPGKQLEQNLLYSGTTEVAREALAEAGVDLQRLLDLDVEPGLGNGGLGRLAACFMESLASLDVPAIGYGMRYQFGIFRQEFQDGWQVERPDDWGRFGNPWEFRQPSDMVEVGLFGHTETYEDPGGGTRTRWVPGEEILGEPHVILVPGYGTRTVNILRLWRAKATEQFDFELFDTGDYARAVEQKVRSENISKVLYPNDSTPQGEELRLKQQYFFVACSLQDILARFRLRHEDWDLLPDKAVVQLNDTHPVVAIPELMRLLIDDHGLDWSRAWSITRRTFAYTCHTLLPEALETWSVELFGRLLPRHLEIVYEINGRFLEDIRARFPDDEERVARMSIIGEGDDRRIRMAHLATVGSFGVNGVAELHTRLLTEHTLSDFAELWPDRFHNKTNGVTPRRFVRIANPRLSELITSAIGDGWISNLESLSELEGFADDRSFQESWREVKRQNKEELAGIVRERTGVELFPGSIYDVLVKRLHEYKRQLLKVLHVVWLYQRIKAEPGRHVHPRTFLFGAKAAPGYHMAKRIIRLVHAVADVVNADRDVDG
ncbi:MAG: glycogen/starch/alpha-glucan family phosphorylase, partial [Planctomycetota bacterium]